MQSPLPYLAFTLGLSLDRLSPKQTIVSSECFCDCTGTGRWHALSLVACGALVAVLGFVVVQRCCSRTVFRRLPLRVLDARKLARPVVREE